MPVLTSLLLHKKRPILGGYTPVAIYTLMAPTNIIVTNLLILKLPDSVTSLPQNCCSCRPSAVVIIGIQQ